MQSGILTQLPQPSTSRNGYKYVVQHDMYFNCVYLLSLIINVRNYRINLIYRKCFAVNIIKMIFIVNVHLITTAYYAMDSLFTNLWFNNNAIYFF